MDTPDVPPATWLAAMLERGPRCSTSSAQPASTSVATASEIRSSTYTPNIPGIDSESLRAISTGRIGSPARPSRNMHENPISVALYTFQNFVGPSHLQNRIHRSARIAKQI